MQYRLGSALRGRSRTPFPGGPRHRVDPTYAALLGSASARQRLLPPRLSTRRLRASKHTYKVTSAWLCCAAAAALHSHRAPFVRFVSAARSGNGCKWILSKSRWDRTTWIVNRSLLVCVCWITCLMQRIADARACIETHTYSSTK